MKLEIGKRYKRTELHNFFGSQSQGGISTPKKYKYVFKIEYENLVRILDMKMVGILGEILLIYMRRSDWKYAIY